MTRTVQRQSPSRDTGPGLPTDVPEAHKMYSANLKPVEDCASDADVGERPIREKLKKTSIASLPKSDLTPLDVDIEEHSDTVMDSQERVEEPLQRTQDGDIVVKERGRPPGKRALEDPDVVEAGKDVLTDISFTSGHVRKRSRDVRSVEDKKSERRRRSPETSVQEEAEDIESQKQDNALRHDLEDTTIEEDPLQSTSEIVDQEMQESVLSPKKKRSRDQFESESHREQKIAATDENRARRRSSEEDRPETAELEIVETRTAEDSDQNCHVVANQELSREELTEQSKTTVKFKWLAFHGQVNLLTSSPIDPSRKWLCQHICCFSFICFRQLHIRVWKRDFKSGNANVVLCICLVRICCTCRFFPITLFYGWNIFINVKITSFNVLST